MYRSCRIQFGSAGGGLARLARIGLFGLDTIRWTGIEMKELDMTGLICYNSTVGEAHEV